MRKGKYHGFTMMHGIVEHRRGEKCSLLYMDEGQGNRDYYISYSGEAHGLYSKGLIWQYHSLYGIAHMA